MTDDTKWPPCEFKLDKIVNFFPRSDGVLERVAARTNAVVISYVEEPDDSGETHLRRYVWVECKDLHLKDELLQRARDIVERLNK